MLQVFFSVGLTNLNALQNAELELTLKAPIPQNGQTHSNNSSANCR